MEGSVEDGVARVLAFADGQLQLQVVEGSKARSVVSRRDAKQDTEYGGNGTKEVPDARCQ